MRRWIKSLSLAVVALVAHSNADARETVELPAKDGILVTADVYEAEGKPDAPWIVLAHQASASRGEYRDIAPKLNSLGYNAIAIDQRSGKSFAGVFNDTAARAKEAGKSVDFVDAIPDIAAGVDYVKSKGAKKGILWGSSYSAALVLLIAGGTPDLVDAVVAMSPGEYIKGKSVAEAAKSIKAPVLLVSPPEEAAQRKPILAAVPHDEKTGFSPSNGGLHGSSALIEGFSPNPQPHWDVVIAFLRRYAPPGA